MSVWLLAAIGLLPPFIVAVVACGRRGTSRRLVAIQFVCSLAVFVFVVLEYALQQASSLGLALAMALLGLPAMLVLVLFRERWL